MSLVRPDFAGGSLLNLVATLETGLGGESEHELLGALPVERVAAAPRVVLLLIDGLGDAFVESHAPWLAERRLRTMTSVFPSATAPAITTVFTGAAPARHGVLGWFMHMAEVDRVMTFLPFRPRLGGPVEATPGPLVGAGSLFDRIDVDGVVVSPKNIVDSAVSQALGGSARRRAYGSLTQCVAQVVAAVREPGERRYVYAYWGMLDALSHQHGCRGRAVVAHLHQLELAIEHLTEELAGTGTLLLVTADHGFTDVRGVDRVSMHPELAACLSLPLCGEPRAAFCHLRDGAEERFRAYVADRLADRFTLLEPAELAADGWFGPGPVDPRTLARLGDFVLLGKDGHVLVDAVAGEAPWNEAGVHGGATEAEMRVPLVAIEC